MLDSLRPYQEFAEILTIIVCAIGLINCIMRAHFFSKGSETTADKLKHVFQTDALVYIITLAMGIALFFDSWASVQVIVILRPLFILFNVLAGIQLYRHFRGIK